MSWINPRWGEKRQDIRLKRKKERKKERKNKV
jgi:hypothetical protein